MYSDKQLQEIRSQAKNCMMELGPLKLDDPSDLYPLIAMASQENDILRFTKSVVLITQEFNISSSPALLPTIHLYGPENLGNNEIIHCHPVIRPPSGKGIEMLQKPKININKRSNFDDIARINTSYEEYIVYLQMIFSITKNFTSDDLISFCYDSVLKRSNINGSHNILEANEAINDVVLSSICRNALRMMRYKTYKGHKFIPPPNESKYLNTIANPCDQYLFCWDKIPGSNDVQLIEFLLRNFHVNWVRMAKIKKSEDNKTINISDGQNYLSLRLDTEKTKVNLVINDGRTDEYIVKMENGMLNIYWNIQCLKDGSLNNITTFLAIYSLNALELPSTIDHICLTLSTRYQHKSEELDKYIRAEYNGVSEYRDLRVRMPNAPHIKKALDIEREAETIKKRVYQIVEKSVAVLEKDKSVVNEGKKLIPNTDSLLIQTKSGFQEIEMPSVETIMKRKNSITKFNSYLKNKRNEWKNN